MTFDIDWIFPRMKYPSKLWKICSYTVIGAVGFFCKIILGKEINGKRRRKLDVDMGIIVYFTCTIFGCMYFYVPIAICYWYMIYTVLDLMEKFNSSRFAK